MAQVIDENNITVNVWERGAGLTKACGTAACATAVAAFKNRLAHNEVDIKFKEGFLNIKIDKTDNILMTGLYQKLKKLTLKHNEVF